MPTPTYAPIVIRRAVLGGLIGGLAMRARSFAEVEQPMSIRRVAALRGPRPGAGALARTLLVHGEVGAPTVHGMLLRDGACARGAAGCVVGIELPPDAERDRRFDGFFRELDRAAARGGSTPMTLRVVPSYRRVVAVEPIPELYMVSHVTLAAFVRAGL